MYIAICEIDGQCKCDAEARRPKPVLRDNPEGLGGEGAGSGVQDGEHLYACG